MQLMRLRRCRRRHAQITIQKTQKFPFSIQRLFVSVCASIQFFFVKQEINSREFSFAFILNGEEMKPGE